MNHTNLRAVIDMIDLSAVKAEQSQSDFQVLLKTAIKYRVKCVFVLPSHTKQVIDALKDYPEILVGGVVGFPGGGTTTASKVFECQELLGMGCSEIDMVMNIALLKSRNYDEFALDIKSVVDCAGVAPVKVILECHHLTDEEIVKASELAASAGADFVKTGTGWAPTGATERNVSLMSKAVAGKCKVKAAGGVRDLETFWALHAAGATRFGLGVATALNIIEGASSAFGGEY
ncbi:deoxyribose-phosphate aldolase [Roseateles sp.]|uniref:deoxyribose-phosphate aldolase n=1 Tax=Roseateles sp. TaxID=1971397 RepID=UPI003D11B4A6